MCNLCSLLTVVVELVENLKSNPDDLEKLLSITETDEGSPKYLYSERTKTLFTLRIVVTFIPLNI